MQNNPNTARTAPGMSGQLDSSTHGQLDNDTHGQLDNSTHGQLAHLSEMDDFEISDGEPDIKGWDVRTQDGEKIGDVEDLIVDTAVMKVRYIEIKLEKELAPNDDRRHALIPIGSARLDDDKDDVVINLQGNQILSLPAYTRGAITREYETELRNGFAQSDNSNSLGRESRAFYDSDDFDEGRAFSGRRTAERRDESYLRRRDS